MVLVNQCWLSSSKAPGHIRIFIQQNRAPDKVRIFISVMSISSPNPMFDHLLESSHRDDSNEWSSIGFGEEIKQVDLIEVNFTHLIWFPGRSFSDSVQPERHSSVRKVLILLATETKISICCHIEKNKNNAIRLSSLKFHMQTVA